MSWDSKALLALMVVWAALSVLYVTVFDMMPGARGWGAGAIIFLALFLGLWYAESRAAAKAVGKERGEPTYASRDVALPRKVRGGSNGDGE